MVLVSRTRSSLRTHRLLIAAGAGAGFVRSASASTLLLAPDCSVAPDTLGCHLLALLKFLYVAASILGLMLVVVVIIAVRSYRKNSRSDEGHRG